MIDEIEALRSELRSSELRIAVLEKTNEGALGDDSRSSK